jgi:hypothetical protein
MGIHKKRFKKRGSNSVRMLLFVRFLEEFENFVLALNLSKPFVLELS